MATKSQRNKIAYGLSSALVDVFPSPIIAQRAPTAADQAQLGTQWIDQPNDDVYVLTKVAANTATWINTGGGAGTFATVTTTAGITAGTTLDVGTSAIIGTTLTVSGLGLGVVQSSAAGLLSNSAGTNGQLLIGGTGIAPAWAAITSATLVITPGANTLNIEESGGTANSFVTDVGGPVAPLIGVTNILGGTNITTDGSVANTITFNLDDDVTLAGFLTVGDTFDMLAGEFTVEANTDIAQAIYLHTDGGTNETIEIHNEQGTDPASIYVHSTVGGLTFESGIASADAINIAATDAAGGIDIDYGTGGMSIVGGNGAFSLDTGTGNIEVGTDAAAKVITLGNVIGATSVVVDCGTGACSFGASATAHTTTIGSVTGAASTIVQSGTGDLILTSTDDITIDAAGVLELNSTAGIIGIGNDADAFAINIGTGAADRNISIGNVTGTTALILDSGTGGMLFTSTGAGDIILDSGDSIILDAVGAIEFNSAGAAIEIGNDADAFAINIGTGAAARDITIGNVIGATSLSFDAGTGGIAITSVGAGDIALLSGDEISLDANGVLELNAGGNISIGNDAVVRDINIGTGAALCTTTIGNAAGASAVAIEVGTGNLDIGVNATDHRTTVGSVTGVSPTTLQSGTGGIVIDGDGIVEMTPAVDTQAAAAVTIDANVGVGTFTGLVTAAAATQVLTVTNAVCTATSAILCTLANKGANDAQCTITRVVPAAGSFTVTYRNNGAAALNGDLILTFWIIA